MAFVSVSTWLASARVGAAGTEAAEAGPSSVTRAAVAAGLLCKAERFTKSLVPATKVIPGDVILTKSARRGACSALMGIRAAC